MNRLRKFSLAAYVVASAGVSVAASAAFTSPRETSVSFTASGPAGLKIEGATSELTVTEEQGNVVIDVPLANLATGIALRDQHMKEKYLEVAKFPDAVLTVGRGALRVPAAGGQITAEAPATLALHGRTRPVTVRYDAAAVEGGLTVHGRVHIRMDDFGITVPSYLGVTVKPDVDVTASFHTSGT